jgi:hypothetical protein
MKKKYLIDALKRGAIAEVTGLPIALIIFMIIYLSIKYATGNTDNPEVNTMYFMLRLVASFYITCFIFGAATEVYQIEELPIGYAIAIHFTCLFVCWFSCASLGRWIDLTNWIAWIISISAFIVTYLIVILIVFAVNKNKVKKINSKFKK